MYSIAVCRIFGIHNSFFPCIIMIHLIITQFLIKLRMENSLFPQRGRRLLHLNIHSVHLQFSIGNIKTTENRWFLCFHLISSTGICLGQLAAGRSRSTLHSRACMPSDHPDLPHGRSRGWSGHPAFHRRGILQPIPPPSLRTAGHEPRAEHLECIARCRPERTADGAPSICSRPANLIRSVAERAGNPGNALADRFPALNGDNEHLRGSRPGSRRSGRLHMLRQNVVDNRPSTVLSAPEKPRPAALHPRSCLRQPP